MDDVFRIRFCYGNKTAVLLGGCRRIRCWKDLFDVCHLIDLLSLFATGPSLVSA